MEITQHLLVSGRVQGVGFRNFTQQCAQNLGLRGLVRNLADGRVEAIVIGSKEKLVQLAAQLRRGPERSNMISIEVKTVDFSTLQQKVVDLQQNVKEFTIAADGVKPWLE